MNNFNIFNSDHISALLQPFADGMAPHITPIKYEAITPDIFAFLFRTSGSDGQEHYFVSLEFDYMENVEAIKQTIEAWHGSSVVDFWNAESDPEGDDIRVKIDDIYYAILAEVEPPKGNGYWASHVIVSDESDIEAAISQLKPINEQAVRESVRQIFIENPGVTISVYIKEDDTVEYFFG